MYLEEYKRNKIDVMEGIDFKGNQARMKKKEAIKRNNEKHEKIELIMYVSMAIICLVLIFILLFSTNKTVNENIKNCVENGNSLSYCQNKYY